MQLTRNQPRQDLTQTTEAFSKAAEAARKCADALRQFGLAATLIKFRKVKK